MARRFLVYVIPILIVAGVTSLLVHRGQEPAAVGEHVPDFNLPLEGSGTAQRVRLANFRGRVLLVNFWATWCPPCIEETPSLEAFAERVRPLGVEVLGVSVDQGSAKLDAFIRRYHLSFPIARDPEQRLAHRYGTFLFPETYIIDRHGRLADKIGNAYDWNDARMLTFVRDLARPGEVQASTAWPTGDLLARRLIPLN